MDIKGLFANMPKRQLYLLLGLVAAGFLLVWWYLLFKPAWDERDQLQTKLAGLEQQLFQKRRIAANLPQLEAEIKQLQERLKASVARLPEEKEIPTLLTQVNSLGEESGLAFTLFRPQAAVKKDFYAEVPIQVRVEGSFHALGAFLDRIGKMDRIVNIGALSVAPAPATGPGGRRRGPDMTIIADFSATTFTFVPTGG
ncbi:MAG: type 4a pilus biogenesis protein PilO [candidate division NC10 bacterium]|nr:type 4a pilus biogenesis protein PilO [candidate division NC10 bacterium]MBI4413227.1 type 4a pilus biogenesis protein PilO [candidate division NC10 bacterium]